VISERKEPDVGAPARYTKQIVILTTPERGQWIKEMKRKYGLSEAQIARDCIELGAELLAGRYTQLGIKRPKSVPRQRQVRVSRVSQPGAAPAAQFVAPVS
jgi:hypothetical protein